jgi:hypothetical protein
VPPGTELFVDIARLSSIKASERFLPELLQAAGCDLAKRDFFLVAAKMRPDEVDPDVVEKLDLIAATLRRHDSQDDY